MVRVVLRDSTGGRAELRMAERRRGKGGRAAPWSAEREGREGRLSRAEERGKEFGREGEEQRRGARRGGEER
eukprot:2142687-Rhodomonas_salina.1